MGLILDFVPNHMGIAAGLNEWWQDVLENGPTSPYAACLRHRLAAAQAGARQQGAAADPRRPVRRRARERRARAAASTDGALLRSVLRPCRCRSRRRATGSILRAPCRRSATARPPDESTSLEFQSIARRLRAAAAARPSDDPELIERAAARRRSSSARLRRSARRARRRSRSAIEAAVADFNGRPGDARQLRPARRAARARRRTGWPSGGWRPRRSTTAASSTINELAAIRQEDPAVFAATHR